MTNENPWFLRGCPGTGWHQNATNEIRNVLREDCPGRGWGAGNCNGDAYPDGAGDGMSNGEYEAQEDGEYGTPPWEEQ